MSTTYQDLSFTTFPEQVQTFVTMLNMTVSDGAAILGYQDAMKNGDTATAQEYFSQIVNANQKFIDSTKMNTLMDTCVALQRFYLTDIEPYVNNKQQSWENIINQFSYKGEYSPSASYSKNNFVTADINGVYQVFICLTSQTPIGTPVTDTTYWRQLTIRGLQGISGVGLTFRYTWDSSQIYYADDVVAYNDCVWCCINENANQAPSTNSSYWQLIYKSQQYIYPFSSVAPSSSQLGSLWFEIVS